MTSFGQSALTLSLSNTNPLEGCDVVDFSLTVCNLHQDTRQVYVEVKDMDHFEVTDWGDFSVGNPGDIKISKNLGFMSPSACTTLHFSALTMVNIDWAPPFTGPVVRATAIYDLNGAYQTVNTHTSCITHGHLVLDGRNTPYSIKEAYQAGLIPNPFNSCDEQASFWGAITVLGEVYFDNQYFNYCVGGHGKGKIRMAPGAEIVVSNDAGLLISADIQGCGYGEMWRQIHVETNGRLMINQNQAHTANIQHAARAISLAPGSNVILRNINFQNNHIGVYAEGDVNLWGPNILQFDNLNFRGLLGLEEFVTPIDEDLKAEPGVDLNLPFAGVYSKNCDFLRLGSSEGTRNTFQGLPNGIFTRNSDVWVQRADFFGIVHPTDGLGQPIATLTSPTGNAIYGSGKHSFLQVLGENSSDRIKIYSATYGIRGVINEGITAKFVDFKNVDYGVFSTSFSAANQFNIEDCEMKNIRHTGLRHMGLGKYKLVRNDIEIRDINNLTQMKGNGIFANNVLQTHQELAISDNIIDLKTAMGGIEAYYSTGEIIENTVNLSVNDNAVRHGIAWHAPFHASVQCNLISGTSYSGLSQTDAMFIGNSSATSIGCNDMNEVGAGLRLFGMHNGMQVRANTFGDHELGLAYGYPNPADQTITGQQALRGNYWPIMHSNSSIAGRYGAIHYGMLNLVDLSPYLVNNSVDQAFMPKWSANGDWFSSDPNNGSNQDCYEDEEPLCEMGPGAFGPHLSDDIDLRIVQDSMPHAEWQYTGSRRLMQRISKYPELLEDTGVQSFYTSAQQSYLGDWHDVDQQVRLAWVMDSTLQAVVEASYSDVQQQIDHIQLVQDSLHAAATTNDSIYWAGQLDTAFMDYHPLYVTWRNWKDSVEQIAISRLTQARTDNAALTTPDLWLSNEKAARHIALSLVIDQRDTLSGTEVTTMEAVANQCPTWGGDAVYQARAILMGVGAYNWDDQVLCVEAEERSSLESRPLSVKLHIQPNPAADQISILSDLKSGSTLRIMDMYGRIIQSVAYNGYGHQLDLSGMSAGRYVVQLIDINGNLEVAPLQVVR